MSAGRTEREDRITRLYQQYSPQIAAYARRRAAPDEAADVVAETFLVAWRRSEDVPVEPHTLPWLYGVARHVLANQRRSARRRGRLWQRLSSQFDDHHTPPAAIEDHSRFELVRRALSELSDDDAEILRLVAWEGMSPAQIAVTLAIEPTTARQRLHRARLRLRRKLDSMTPTAEPAERTRRTPARTGSEVIS